MSSKGEPFATNESRTQVFLPKTVDHKLWKPSIRNIKQIYVSVEEAKHFD